MENYMIKTRFASLARPKDQANKPGINLMICILICVENCLLYDAIHDF